MTTATLADLAVTRPAAARVFYRHGLDLCCGGRRPLVDACAERGLDADALMAAIDAEAPLPGDERRWDVEPLPALIDFIVGTCHRRLREALPELVRMARTVETRHAGKAACPAGLADHLAQMHAAVLEHLEKEEQVLFPLIAAGQGRSAVGPVHVMEREHDEHARNLATLRRLAGDFRLPPGACAAWQALCLALTQLEQELIVHIHLENNVLFRRALSD